MCDYAKPIQPGQALTSPLALKLRGDVRRLSSRSACEIREKENTKSVHELVESEPVEILPYLYLGSDYHASQKGVLQHLGITAVINVSRTIPCYFVDTFTYKTIPVDDTYSADIGSWFEEAAVFIGKSCDWLAAVIRQCTLVRRQPDRTLLLTLLLVLVLSRDFLSCVCSCVCVCVVCLSCLYSVHLSDMYMSTLAF